MNSIRFTIDTIDDGFQLAAFLLVGVGLLAFTYVAARMGAQRTAWSRGTLAIALVVLALAGAYAAQAYDLVDVLLVAGGAIALPAWLVWSGRLLGEPAQG